jgi:hypothetical protein
LFESRFPAKRSGFPALLNCLHFNIASVEEGIQTAEHAVEFFRTLNGNRMILADEWESGKWFEYVDIANIERSDMEDIFSPAVNRLQNYTNWIQVMRQWSLDASQFVANNSIGYLTLIDTFYFFNARYDYGGFFSDLVGWWPKSVNGGLLAGHDSIDGELPEENFKFFVKSVVKDFLDKRFGKALETLETLIADIGSFL